MSPATRTLRALLLACLALSANACATVQEAVGRDLAAGSAVERPAAVAAVAAPTAGAANAEADALPSPPHPNPLPRERGRSSQERAVTRDAPVATAAVPRDNPLSPARGGEGWGEGDASDARAATVQGSTASTTPIAPSTTTAPADIPSRDATTVPGARAASLPGATRAVPATTAPTPSAASAVGSTVFALLLIVALILALAWLARRMPGVGAQAGGALRIVGSLALSPRERVVVVDVGGQQLLLSTGTGGTRLLQALDAPLPTAPTPQPFKPFAQVLAQQFGRKP